MAVVVEVLQLEAPKDAPPGQKISGFMSIAMTGDYDAPMPFQAQVQY